MNQDLYNAVFVWLCPNCGEKLSALNKDNTGKNTCPRCGASQIFKRMGRKHSRIDIYKPTA